MYSLRNCLGCVLKTNFISKETVQGLYLSRRQMKHNINHSKISFVPTKVNVLQGFKCDSDDISSNDLTLLKQCETGSLEKCEEDVSDISPFLPRSFNLAAYVNKSPTLKQLIKMGVDLHKIENMKGGAAEFILNLDFDKHMKSHLRYLHDIGVPAEEFGRFVTNNPFIFQQSLEDLEVRINYLKAKKFTPEQISRIVTRNPKWLNFSTMQIDKRLGFFQRTFTLSGDEVRLVAAKAPLLITHELKNVLETQFAFKENMGFSDLEIKNILISKSNIFRKNLKNTKDCFDYIHNIMGISHEQICQHPNVLTFRTSIVKSRHEFLKELGKAQYNSKLAGYVSLDTLVQGDDMEFCKNVAKTSLEVYDAFLKTL